MTTILHSSGPHDPIRQILTDAVATAKRVQGAVAFVTRAGVEFVLKEINAGTEFRIVTSVRWPTDIVAVADLAKRRPDSVWIHLAGVTPQEKAGEKYQMHSKVVAIEYEHGNFRGFVGSHNWTFAALDGVNLEATVEVACATSDAFAGALLGHIEACVSESEPFDVNKVDVYLAIQRALHPGPLPDVVDSANDFSKYPAIVIHAEDPRGISEKGELRLYVGPQGEIASEFVHDRAVDLYLYPAGSLLKHERPTTTPIFFEGSITLVNTKADAPVQEREVNCAILNLTLPEIQPVETFPRVPTARREVAIRLDNRGRRSPFVYHSGPRQSRPTVRDEVSFRPAPIPGLPPIKPEIAKRYLKYGHFVRDELWKEVPATVQREIVVAVPSPSLYPENPLDLLREKFSSSLKRRPYADELFLRGVHRVDDDFVIRDTASEASRFVFRASHRSKT